MKDEYSGLYEKVEALLLLPRLRTCRSAVEVTRMVHRVFEECFGYIEARAERLYEPIGAEIWSLWVAFQEPTRP